MESRYPSGKDSTIKSACAASSATRSRPAAESRLAVTDFFPAWYAIAYRLRSGPGRSSRNGGMVRLEHPSGGSTLMTSAPMSAKILPHSAPFSSVRSSIRNPLSSSDTITAISNKPRCDGNNPEDHPGHINRRRLPWTRERAAGCAGARLILSSGSCRADGGGVIGVLGDQKAAAERIGQPLGFLHKREQPRKLAGQNDIFLAARARAGHGQDSDRFHDHVHDRQRLVLRRRIGADLAEIRRGSARIQVADRAPGDIAHGEIDPAQITPPRHLLKAFDGYDSEHMLGQAKQGTTAYSRAAHMDYLAGRDRNHRGAGSQRDNQRIFLVGQPGSADTDGGELADL